MIILWIILSVLAIAGLIRIIVKPYDGFFNLLLDFLWIDILINVLAFCFENIGELLD